MLDRKQVKQLKNKLLEMDWGYDIDYSFVIYQPEEVKNRFFILKFDYDTIDGVSTFKEAFFREEDGKLTDIKFLIPKKLAKKIRDIALSKWENEQNKTRDEAFKKLQKEKEETAKKLMNFIED